MKKVIDETLKSDVIVCMLNPKLKNNRVGAPNKLFEAMVCGRPVIATEGTYSGNLVEKLQMGLTIKYDKESFRNAVIKLRDNPDLRKRLGKNALKAAIEKYNWTLQERELIKIYENI